MPYNKNDLAYIAGFIDGEGSIHFNRKNDREKPYVRPVLNISQSDKSILEWISKKLNVGNVNTIYQTLNIPFRKKAYHIQYGDRQAYEVIKLVYPYLRVKRKQADLIIKFYNQYLDKANYSEEKLCLATECHNLNYNGNSI